MLAGPRTTTDNQTPAATNTAVDPEAGVIPPPWWHGDEEAARSGLTVTTR